MSNVTVKPMPDVKPARQPSNLDLVLGRIGMWLMVLAFGGVAWSINGGFSVIGLGVVASSFNDAGRLFWAAATSIQFAVPVKVPGLPETQPLIPWIGVVAGSLLQISVIWRKLSGRSIPLWLLVSALLMSVYDYATTLFGLGTVEWIAKFGILLQIPLAALFTFAVEGAIGYALRGGKR